MHVARTLGERHVGSTHEAVLDLGGPDTEVDLDGLNGREVGRYGERVAELYLRERGLEVLDRNWSCSYGEVDLVAEDDGVIVLVEVKTRRVDVDAGDVAPEIAVNSRKRNRYQRIALVYLAKQTRYDSVRFDVVALQMPNAKTARLRYLQAAYEWDR